MVRRESRIPDAIICQRQTLAISARSLLKEGHGRQRKILRLTL
jgi:hypothetical protein